MNKQQITYFVLRFEDTDGRKLVKTVRLNVNILLPLVDDYVNMKHSATERNLHSYNVKRN